MKTPTYFLAFVVAALTAAGGYYAYQLDRSTAQSVFKPEAESNAFQSLPETALSILSYEEMDAVQERNVAQGVDLDRRIAITRAQQIKRDEQIKAYRKVTRPPSYLPAMPVIEPLQYPRITPARNQVNTGFGVGETYTLPPDVMTKFTNETGLSQDEINQAMNR